MLKLRPGIQIYLSVSVVDMRKSIDTLSALVVDEFNGDPRSGNLFLFLSRAFDKLKILYWDRNGFCLWQKRLEKYRFRWPEPGEDVVEIDGRELLWLLEGLDLSKTKGHGRLGYTAVS